jgi:hypothetical protein
MDQGATAVTTYELTTSSGIRLRVERDTRVIRPACGEEPADVTVTGTRLYVNDVGANPYRYMELVQHVECKGRVS